MALGKFQLQIVSKLVEMERLTEEQRDTIAEMPEELNGDQLDKLLQDEYKISSFQMLTAKGRAFGLAPFNVARFRTGPSTFERLPQEFCQEHLIVPVGQVGDFILVAFANPFEVSLPAKIQEMTGMRVIRMLGREKDIREKFVASPQAAGFDDVVSKIGA
jgi:type IV pilus assembly protein PilB